MGPVFEFALAKASHGYILGAHMNEHTLLNNVMVYAKGTFTLGWLGDSPCYQPITLTPNPGKEREALCFLGMVF